MADLFEQQLLEAAPQFIEFPKAYVNAAAAGPETAVKVKTLHDNFIWEGICHKSTNNFRLWFRMDGTDEWLPLGSSGSGYAEVKASLFSGTGARPLFFPAPKLLRKNSTIRLNVRALTSASNDIYVQLIGRLATNEDLDLWKASDVGLAAYASSTAGWTVASGSRLLGQVELLTAWDFAMAVVNGSATSSAMEIRIRDALGLRRDGSGRQSGYCLNDQPGSWANHVGVASAPRWWTLPYIWHGDGQITVELENKTATAVNVAEMLFLGAKIPVWDSSREKRYTYLREMLRTASRRAPR